MTQTIMNLCLQKYVCQNDPQGPFCFRTAVKALNLMCHGFNNACMTFYS